MTSVRSLVTSLSSFPFSVAVKVTCTAGLSRPNSAGLAAVWAWNPLSFGLANASRIGCARAKLAFASNGPAIFQSPASFFNSYVAPARVTLTFEMSFAVSVQSWFGR